MNKTVPLPLFLGACGVIVVLLLILMLRGCGPSPDPTPPPPPKASTVLVVLESASMHSLQAPQLHMLVSLTAREAIEQYAKFWVVDYDIATNNTVYNLPGEVVSTIKAVPKTAGPFMLILDKDNKATGPFVVPSDVSGLVNILTGKERPKPLRVQEPQPNPHNPHPAPAPKPKPEPKPTPKPAPNQAEDCPQCSGNYSGWWRPFWRLRR